MESFLALIGKQFAQQNPTQTQWQKDSCFAAWLKDEFHRVLLFQWVQDAEHVGKIFRRACWRLESQFRLSLTGALTMRT